MTSANSLKRFEVCLGQRLATLGFAAHGDHFSRPQSDTMLVVQVQKDQKYSTKNVTSLTINLGVSINILRSKYGVDGESALRVENCHWRERLGRLAPSAKDVWWKIDSAESVNAVCEAVANATIEVALPQLVAIASSDALLSMWKEGRGRGLTEYERRLHLARLLTVLKRTDEAVAAIQQLTDASIGKAWEPSARFEMNKLIGVRGD